MHPSRTTRSVAFLIATAALIGCSPNPEAQLRSQRQPFYFGYYASARVGIGSNGGNYTAATADHANVTWIGDSAEGTLAKVNEAKALGMKSIVDTAFFFDCDEESICSLAPDYLERWQEFFSTLTSNGNDLRVLESVAAFYPLDEPNCQGVSASDLATAATTIRSTIQSKAPGLRIPIAVIYCYTNFNGGRPDFIAKEAFDWIGFDCYPVGADPANPKVLFSCPAYAFNGIETPQTPFADAYSELAHGLKPGQETILVPQASIYPDCATEASGTCLRASKKALVDEAALYRAFANEHSEVAGIFPYLYQTDTGWIGVEELPDLREAWFGIGKNLGHLY